MTRPALFAALLLLVPANAHGQAVSRADPAVRLARFLAAEAPPPAIRPFDPIRTQPPGVVPRRPTGAGAAIGAAIPGAAALEVMPGGQPWVRVLARLGPGGAGALERHGARVAARAGSIVTARVPASALPGIIGDSDVAYIETATWLDAGHGPRTADRPPPVVAPFSLDARARLARSAPPSAGDRAVPDIGASRLRQRIGDRFLGLAGQGVVIGIVDTGLDLGHPDFRAADGGTRVLLAWDQTVDGRAPGNVGEHALDYGHECVWQEIDAGQCPLVDRNGHGTHVAGIAAGTGAATGNDFEPYRFTGAAPAADLIIVKGGDSGFTSDRIVDGVAYIFARAAELGRAATVNLSLSTQAGPHDGSTLLERALDALSGAGRVIVGAAGNQGSNGNEQPAFVRTAIHATGELSSGGVAVHELVVPAYSPRPGSINDGAALELWYDGSDSLAITVTTPGGESIRVQTGDTVLAETAAGGIFVSNGAGGPEAINGDHLCLIALFDADEAVPPAPGRWRITVDGAAVHSPGIYHMWLVGSTMAGQATATSLEGGTRNSHLVSSPGTAGRVITAAAHVTRHDWWGPDGAATSFPFREPLGDIAFFSSPGPRRDRVFKPEISAPGKMVISARAAEGQLWKDFDTFLEADGVHAALLGTSMAAPQVAGAVALLLQLEPTLTPEAARDLLTAAARQDEFTRRTYAGGGRPPIPPSAHWGSGKLDVERAVWRLNRPAAELVVDVAPAGEPSSSSARGTRMPLLRLRFEAGPEEAVAVERLTFDMTGADPDAAVILVRDDDGDLRPGPDEPVVASRRSASGAGPVRIELTTGPVIPAGFRQDYLLALELSGAAPNASSFAATYVGGGIRTRGTLSGAENRLAGGAAPVESGARATSLLEAGERVNLSANPVRGDVLVINYAERPRVVGIYTIAGRRVRRLEGADLGPGSAVWDLRDERGRRLANGVFLVVVDFGGERVLRKIFVSRR